MTEPELEIFRLKTRQEVLLNLMRGLYTGLASISPSADQVLREKFSKMRQESQQVVLKGIDPAYSDLSAAEYQDACEDILSFIEAGFSKKSL
jgi:hypothetical protein